MARNIVRLGAWIRTRTRLICALGLACSGSPVHAQQILFVDDDAPGGDGSSWTQAMNDLQIALNVPNFGRDLEIRVAQGRYVPSARTNPADPRSATFMLRNNLALRGGYAGIDAADPDARDPQIYVSILSGDLNGDDLPQFGNYGENTYHVLTAIGTDATAVLDGFTISGGNANVQTNTWEIMTWVGGGILNYQGSPSILHCNFSFNKAISGGALCSRQGSPSIHACDFIRNRVGKRGGAIYNVESSSPPITECRFIANISMETGGAASYRTSSEPHFVACVFEANEAGAGAGIHATQDPHHALLESCSFRSNIASAGGGAVTLEVDSSATIDRCQFKYNHGGVVGGALTLSAEYGMTPIYDLVACEFIGNKSSFVGGALVCGGATFLTNCVFSRNSSSWGGAFYVAEDVIPQVVNCTFFGHEGTLFGDDGAPVLWNCIVWDNADPSVYAWAVSYSNIEGGWSGAGSNNINSDPMFLQAGCDDFRLTSGSPCLDAGLNDAIPDGVTTDLAGNPRIQNGTVDMGAYEGTHEPQPPMACDDDLDMNEMIELRPSGGSFDPINGAGVQIINTGGPGNAWVNVTEFVSDMHPDAGGFSEIGSILGVETSLAPGNFFMTVYIPFDLASLNWFEPFDIDLTHFDPNNNNWSLAVQGNIADSPGHSGPVGDRLTYIGNGKDWIGSLELGDYGVFWNPQLNRGFAWANVDHASEFAVGYRLPQCIGDCAFPGNGIVDAVDLNEVLSNWGLPTPGTFADINEDGSVDVLDLLLVINHWGSCPR